MLATVQYLYCATGSNMQCAFSDDTPFFWDYVLVVVMAGLWVGVGSSTLLCGMVHEYAEFVDAHACDMAGDGPVALVCGKLRSRRAVAYCNCWQ